MSLILTNLSVTAQNRVTVVHNKYAHKGDSVYIEMMVDLNNADIPKNTYVLLTPTIKLDSISKELPSVIINGKKRVTAYRRLVALNREPFGAGLVIHMGEKDMPQSYDYSATVPFEPWMKEAEFSIREDQCECNGPLVKMSFNLIVGQMDDLNQMPEPLNLTASFKKPNPEPVKHRSQTGKAYLDFDMNSYGLNPNFSNNAAELAKIGKMIQKTQSDPAISFTGIVINGYASPEGDRYRNIFLAQKRAIALKENIRTSYGIDESYFKLNGNGEDWKGLEELMIVSNATYKTDVLEIIRSTDNVELRKKKLKELNGGAPYRDLFTIFYPKLRRSEYELQYTVIPFTVEEGKEKLETNPSLLSLNEMFLIAETYPVGSAEFQRVFDIAAETYPDNDIANINAAANALILQDISAAQNFLEKVIQHDDAYWNNLGMLSAMQGNTDQAAEYFRKAIEEGNTDAVENLAKIEKNKKTLYSVIN